MPVTNKVLAENFENLWQMCNTNRDAFRQYLKGDALSLRNLDWLFRHEMTKRYLESALARIDKKVNKIAFGCISRIREFFDLEINVNDEGDPDDLQDFMEACYSLLAEARADLRRQGENYDLSFEPLEIYLADMELGTFGFYPIRYNGGSDDGIASWQH